MANPGGMTDASSPRGPGNDLVPTTVASFAPVKASSYASPRNTVVIHQKSPLLVATPPQVTRALAYSHPFLLPLNRLTGLISWSTGDPWESFLFLCAFWATVLYGDVLIVFAGPVVLVFGLMAAMYSRRFSPLSSYASPASSKDHRRTGSEVVPAKVGESSVSKASSRNQKSLDDIVDTLNELTLRCNTLLDPLLKMTDFLSTQYSATSASTRPALVRLLTRMLAVLPVWIILSLRPVHLITGRRVVFVVGTLILTWHSKPARVCRTLLWRSRSVRRACNVLTGLEFPGTLADDDEVFTGAPGTKRSSLGRRKSQRDAANHLASSTAAAAALRHRGEGVRFNFSLFENQRRWIGVGWTTTLLAYERAAWTDEHMNACPSKDEFQLPKVEGGAGAWRWVPGSEWHLTPVETEGERRPGEKKFAPSSVSIRGKGSDDEGWIYYDNNWAGGRGQDGWGRYTRRRKWVREAELVEVGAEDSDASGNGADRPKTAASELPAEDMEGSRATTATGRTDDGEATGGSDSRGVKKRRGLFSRKSTSGAGNSNKALSIKKGSSSKSDTSGSILEDDSDKLSTRRLNEEGEDERSVKKENWEVGDDMKMAIG